MERKEIVDAAITAIENSISTADKWALLFTFLVVIGVAGELWVGVYHWIMDKKMVPLRAEQSRIHESEIAELTSSSKKAEAQAAEAKLALEKLKAPRRLSTSQMEEISSKVSRFRGTHFDISAIVGDPEALALVGPIASALRNAGWIWVEFNHPNGPFMTVYSIPGEPNIGQVGTQAVTVAMHADHQREFTDAAAALSEALVAHGIQANYGITDREDIPNHDTAHILVGRKPVED